MVQDQTRDHDVEAVARDRQGFGGTHLELAIRNRCSFLTAVVDHRLGWVNPNDDSVRTDGTRDKTRQVAGPAAHVEHTIT